MLVDYDSLSENSKVWIYPSNRKFYPNEIAPITEKVNSFLTDWKTNNSDIAVSVKILYNRFIVVFTSPETPLTTTAIDILVAFIIKLQEEYSIDLLDKMNVCFKQGEYVQYKDLKEFKKLIKNKAVTQKTIVFDNLVHTKIDFENYWEIPASESWYKNLFK